MTALDFGTHRPNLVASTLIGASRLLSRTPLLSTRRFFKFLLSRFCKGPFDVTALGVRLRSHPWDNISDCRLLLTPRHFCPRELAVLRRALAGGGTFVDIGANVGAFTLQAARFDNVRVLAIEPNPIAMQRLRANLQLNGFENTSTIEAALGATAEESSFTFVHDDIGKSAMGSRPGTGEREVRTLSTRTLVEILAEHEVDSISALKIDVEGHEDEILIPFFESAPHSQWPRLLVMEDNGLSPGRVLSVLEHRGYTETLRTGNNVLLALSKSDEEPGPRPRFVNR